MKIFNELARRRPNLKSKLIQAGIPDSPEEYVKKTFLHAIYLAFGICFVLFLFLLNFLVFLAFPFLSIILYFYFLNFVEVKIAQIKKDIDQEIVFACRFLVIEVQSGVPLFNAIHNIEKNYKIVGHYFGDVVNKVYLGTSLEDALNETMILTPCNNLRKILWQILNSLKTGSDMGKSLNSVTYQIMQEQKIAVQDYGKKLNPLAMFYMMIAIIIPSLGVVMLVVLSTFLGLNINLSILIFIAFFLGFVQFMFLSIIKSMRPHFSA